MKVAFAVVVLVIGLPAWIWLFACQVRRGLTWPRRSAAPRKDF